MSGSEIQQVHRLPHEPVVERVTYLRSLARGKRVIHVGFWGTEGIRQQDSGLWLHAQLANDALELIGIDINSDGVRQARSQGFEAYEANCCDSAAIADLRLPPADVVVAGELIEHLDAPGSFLDAMHLAVRPEGILVITTPNAYAAVNMMGALVHREAINPDHVTLYSWYTLSNLLRRHGWDVRAFRTYHYPRPGSLQGKFVFGLQRLLSSVSPFVAHGLIAVCGSRSPSE